MVLVVTGKKDEEDPDLTHTALREVDEEIGKWCIHGEGEDRAGEAVPGGGGEESLSSRSSSRRIHNHQKEDVIVG